MGKKEIRAECRRKWGSSWHKVHPLIKKARIALAEKELGVVHLLTDTVVVHEGGESYTV